MKADKELKMAKVEIYNRISIRNKILTGAMLKLLACSLLLANAKPHLNTNVLTISSTCPDIEKQPKDLGSIANEQTFLYNTVNDLYFCRKMFGTDQNVIQIVRQQSWSGGAAPDTIEATDCLTYYYILKFDTSCNFDASDKNCVTFCNRNNICPKESDLCIEQADFIQYNPESDLNPSHEWIYNFNDTLRKHCDEKLLENELPSIC